MTELLPGQGEMCSTDEDAQLLLPLAEHAGVELVLELPKEAESFASETATATAILVVLAIFVAAARTVVTGIEVERLWLLRRLGRLRRRRCLLLGVALTYLGEPLSTMSAME